MTHRGGLRPWNRLEAGSPGEEKLGSAGAGGASTGRSTGIAEWPATTRRAGAGGATAVQRGVESRVGASRARRAALQKHASDHGMAWIAPCASRGGVHRRDGIPGGSRRSSGASSRGGGGVTRADSLLETVSTAAGAVSGLDQGQVAVSNARGGGVLDPEVRSSRPGRTALRRCPRIDGGDPSARRVPPQIGPASIRAWVLCIGRLSPGDRQHGRRGGERA